MIKAAWKIYVAAGILAALVCALVVGSLAWFISIRNLDITVTTLTAADSLSMELYVPSHQENGDSYKGQTGIKYNGDDSPYVVRYFPLDFVADISGERPFYFKTDISAVFIETLLPDNYKHLTAEEIRKNFTVRLTLFNLATQGETIYRPENGFLKDGEGNLLEVEGGRHYVFRLEVIFLGEQGYSLLESTMADISSFYTFEYSDKNFYLWADFHLTIRLSVRNLLFVNFDSRGGSAVPRRETTGGGLLDLPIPSYDGHIFLGWYDNPGLAGEPFGENTLQDKPRDASFTLYAKWEES
jgi:Listeria-Bacteroides repeat domain (List_Bact_rpt).